MRSTCQYDKQILRQYFKRNFFNLTFSSSNNLTILRANVVHKGTMNIGCETLRNLQNASFSTNLKGTLKQQTTLKVLCGKPFGQI